VSELFAGLPADRSDTCNYTLGGTIYSAEVLLNTGFALHASGADVFGTADAIASLCEKGTVAMSSLAKLLAFERSQPARPRTQGGNMKKLAALVVLALTVSASAFASDVVGRGVKDVGKGTAKVVATTAKDTAKGTVKVVKLLF
jgi:hypothetical protein